MDTLSGDIYQCEVEETHVTDKDGCKLRLYKLVDIDYLMSPWETFDNMKHFPDIVAYPDDIVVCGYLKCGTHWVWEIINMLLSKNSDYVKDIKENYMFDAISDAEYFNRLKRPRIFNCHFPPKLLPPQFLAQQSRLIYLTRHPKDVAVSLYNHVTKSTSYRYNGKWDAFLELFLDGKVEYGNFGAYEKVWKQFMEQNKVHVIQYEDMKLNPMEKIKELAEFLQVDIEDKLVMEIVVQTDFAKMKVSKSKFDSDQEKEKWVNKKPLMYRKGIIGDWKNWFTVRQSEDFDTRFNN